MAASLVKVWVKVVDGKRRECTSVHVAHDADIDDVVDRALEKEKVDISPDLVEVKYNGEVLRRGQLISKTANTSAVFPLLLHCRVEGMQITVARYTCMVLLCVSLCAFWDVLRKRKIVDARL